LAILFVPAILAGGTTTIIAWDLFPHSHAIIYGSTVSIAFIFMSFFVVLAIVAVVEAASDRDNE
jgi:hypothetical protein